LNIKGGCEGRKKAEHRNATEDKMQKNRKHKGMKARRH